MIRDDGVALAQRGGGALHGALRRLQLRMEDVGGALDVARRTPTGLRLTASVPAA